MNDSWGKLFLLLLCVTALNAAIYSGNANEGESFKWQLQESGTKASLRGVSAVNNMVAWASGSSGTILKTVDGGKSWITVKTPGDPGLDYRDVQAFDADTAVVMSAGRPAMIYKTKDGSKNWNECYNNNSEGVFLNSIAFWNNRHGLAVGDPLNGYFMVLRTEDGGESWNRVAAESIPNPHDGEAEFAASGTCVEVFGDGMAWFVTGGSAARVFRSADYGKKWEVVDTPILRGKPSQGIFSVAFFDAMNGTIVGGDYQDPERKEANAAVTTDGGATWKLIETNSPPGFRSCVMYAPHDSGATLISVGTSGSDFSLDGGNSWHSFSKTGFHAISVSPAGTGWAVGSDGRIAQLLAEASHTN